MKTSFKNVINAMMVISAGLAMIVLSGCIGTESTVEVPLTPVAGTDDAGDAPADTGAGSDTTASIAALPELEKFEVPVPEPTADKVVTIGSGVKPGSSAPGSVVTFAVRVRTMKPWHIYAIKGHKPTGVSVPSQLKLKLPAGVTQVGEWNIPDPKKYEEDTFIYEEDAVFRCQLKIADDATGLLDVGCEVKYQPCNDQSCKAPTSEKTSIALEVAAP